MAGGMLGDMRGFGGPDQEFAWAAITKFDDLESYPLWVKRQLEIASNGNENATKARL